MARPLTNAIQLGLYAAKLTFASTFLLRISAHFIAFSLTRNGASSQPLLQLFLIYTFEGFSVKKY